jgi:cation diffusion facilitator CzcD-associated flavoprotein CzcO
MSPSKLATEVFDDDVPILIIGGGPSGLLLAHMLARLNGQFFAPSARSET